MYFYFYVFLVVCFHRDASNVSHATLATRYSCAEPNQPRRPPVRRWSAAALARSRGQQIVLSVTCLFARIAAIHLSFPLLSRSAATDLFSLLFRLSADFFLFSFASNKPRTSWSTGNPSRWVVCYRWPRSLSDVGIFLLWFSSFLLYRRLKRSLV